MSPVISPPSLQEATSTSTTTWQNHLENLFHQAKERFPDVVWELNDEVNFDEVWGHKGAYTGSTADHILTSCNSHRVRARTTELPESIFFLSS